jgi:hypothetical protein
MDLLPKSLSNCDFKHRRHQSFSLTAVTQRVTQHGMAYNNRHRQPTSLICTFTCFAHIPSFCVLFPHKHVDGRASTNMLRDYGAGEDSTTKNFAPRQWWLSFFSSRVRARKLFFKRRRFLDLFDANGRSTALLFSAGVITGWLGFTTEEKNGSRTKGCDAVTRLDPTVDIWQGVIGEGWKSRAVVVALLSARCVFAAVQLERPRAKQNT